MSDWDRFKALVDGLDPAIAEPLLENSAWILRGGDAVVDADAHRLAFWLAHVGEALK